MTRNLPTYSSAVEACKVGCFGCGAILDSAKVVERDRKPGLLPYFAVTCDSCGDVKSFRVSTKKSPEPKRQTKNTSR